jgi:iron complex outermembrane recepter protein
MSGSRSRKGTYPAVYLVVPLALASAACLAGSAKGASSTQDANDKRLPLAAGVRSARDHANSLRGFTGYEVDPGACGDQMLGPLPKGRYTGEEAWRKLVEPVCHLVERRDWRTGQLKWYADRERCTCSFGFDEFTEPQSGSLEVTGSQLPMLGEYIPSEVVVLHRTNIEETGADSVADLLRHVSQTAFSRGKGFLSSGAQYAELRGLGAEYSLVLLNGRRGFGTAADLATSAYDLSSIPISAVKRVEISTDASSLIHGMDAIGGIVNVVLDDSIKPEVLLRHDYVAGGGSQTHAAASGGVRGDRGRLAVYLDYQHWSELLGQERSRWNNQDFRRFYGTDYRSRWASPANVSSLDGGNLPGLTSPSAIAAINPQTGLLEYESGQESLQSLRAKQAIVPEGSRATLWANGMLDLGRSVATFELLASQRDNTLQTMPVLSPGFIWGANHPENPFGVPVRLEASFAGLPIQRERYTMDSLRAVAEVAGPIGSWDYSFYVTHSDEAADTRTYNAPNMAALAQGLLGEDRDRVLSLYRTVQPGAVPSDLFVDQPPEHYNATATHLQGSLQGGLLDLPTGRLIARVGVERRHEKMNFGTLIRDASREITSASVHLRVPLLDPSMEGFWAQDLQLLLGARADEYSDIGSVTKTQLGVTWRMTKSLSLQATTSGTFRPPSLVDLYFPRTSVTTQIRDTRRDEAVPVELTGGGNSHLRPTQGRSSSLGVSFQAERFTVSAEYWRIKVQDHIVMLAPLSLLAHEDSARPGLIIRTDPTSAGPGRLVSLDISRTNVGGALTEGVDLAGEVALKTRFGAFTPRVSVTLTDKFKYSDLPVTQSQMEDRVGTASEYGTIPKVRAVVSLAYQKATWSGALNARLISAYKDRDPITGAPLSRRVSGGGVLDVNVSKALTEHLSVTLGAFNVTNREPPYASIGGSIGFDSSQASLVQRELSLSLTGRF